MERKLILGSELLEITLSRLGQELVENHQDFRDSVLIGLQKGGTFVAKRLHDLLKEKTSVDIPLGYLDVTFYRDDFRRRETPLSANKTNIPFAIEQKKVILVDDVLYTGRTIRAALDALLAFGRPARVELLVLINRRYSRHLPIEPNYVGKEVNTVDSQRVMVSWKENPSEEDGIWLVEKQLV